MNLRLFIACVLSPEWKEHLRKFIEVERRALERLPRVRVLPPPSWHVTLLFIGSAPADSVDWIVGRMRECAGTVLSSIRLVKPALVWAPPQHARVRMLWLAFQPDTQMETLAFSLYYALRPALTPEKPRSPFIPHVTLARFGWVARSALPSLRNKLPSEPLTVSQMELWQSELTPQGARYTTLAIVPLGG